MKRTARFYKKLTALVLGSLMATSTAWAADTVDLDLENCIQMALGNNRTLRQSSSDVRSAEWALSAARRRKGPSFSWSSGMYGVGGEYYDNNGYDSTNFSNSGTLTYHLLGGGYDESIASAGYGVNSADLTYENQKQTTRYQAMAYYYDILRYRNYVKTEQESVENLVVHLDNVNAQYRVGTVAKSDVLDSKVKLANAQQALVNYQNQYDIAMATLNNYIGLPTDTVLNLRDELGYKKYQLNVEECTAYALKHRPDVIAADYAVKQAEISIASAKADARPSLDATASDSIAGKDPFGDSYRPEGWQAGVALSWNIFDNNTTAATVRQREAALEKAQESAADLRDQVHLDVRSQYLSMLAAEKNIGTTAVAVEQAEEDYRIAQVRYSAGVGTNLDAMDANNTLTQAKQNYYNALYNYNVSKAALDKAMGVSVDLDVIGYQEIDEMPRRKAVRDIKSMNAITAANPEEPPVHEVAEQPGSSSDIRLPEIQRQEIARPRVQGKPVVPMPAAANQGQENPVPEAQAEKPSAAIQESTEIANEMGK